MIPTPLPPEWLVRVSRSKGKIYYYHPLTHKTQWSRPICAVDHESTAQGEAEQGSKRQKLDHERGYEDTVSEEEENVLQTLIFASMRVGGSHISRGNKRTVKFTPWPHQLTAVEKIITAIQTRRLDHVKMSQTRESFLLQHSTGAGKTVTIAALTHQLLYVKDALSMQFHTVVVMLDRVKLNQQVGDAVEKYLRRNGVDEVFRAESAEHLVNLLDAEEQLQNPQRVIITTTQKIALLVKDDVLLTRLLYRNQKKANEEKCGSNKFQRVAIITDEAHRTHTASTRNAIEKVIKAGKDNSVQITFIGFTATPTTDALKLFGSRTEERFIYPFHCYSIAQATADGRIMDTLNEYTCICCEIETSVFPDAVQTSLRMHPAAQRRMLDHASDDISVLKAKALIMMTDFLAMKQECPNVKCMIVVRSRQDVVRYFTLITTFITKKMLGWICYAAFSGTVTISDQKGVSTSVTESTLNNQSVTVATSDVVIVCDKLDTGYNEPLLACMYVDRYLRSSVHTVQLLSRLNRRHMNKPSIRVLDFANHAAQVRRSFADFWRDAMVPISADTVDVRAEQMDLATALVILCDYFQELCSAPIETKTLCSTVVDHAFSLERDAFQQVLDALRRAASAMKKLKQTGRADYFDSISPFSCNVLDEVKKEIEIRVVAMENDMELLLDDIKLKMSARVKTHSKSFSGALYPQSLLASFVLPVFSDRYGNESKPSEMVAYLLRYGELERFESLLVAISARNNQHNVDSLVTQVTQAATQSSAYINADQPRISTHISAMLQELDRGRNA
ncbi:hypothetical protein PsorP6_017207 [Peronosclerospora sorghi]|uniref:Uncharacterized protein n=1 Tax=Peronosclerospora sorghi TaxID=230839 RepID=A0ACC0WDZ0_9STRA|nr:hypothetical protein PsorP6_017207 [Peronosclerospora sorghi]